MVTVINRSARFFVIPMATKNKTVESIGIDDLIEASLLLDKKDCHSKQFLNSDSKPSVDSNVANKADEELAVIALLHLTPFERKQSNPSSQSTESIVSKLPKSKTRRRK